MGRKEGSEGGRKEGRKGGREGGEPTPPPVADAGGAPGDPASKTGRSQTRRLDAPDRGVAQRAPRSPGASGRSGYF